MEERLKELIVNNEHEFTEVFLAWLDNHDDVDITCMTDVIDTLVNEFEEDLSRGDI